MTVKAHQDVEIVAELAQGFEGNPVQTKLLLKAAATAGADAAKYQLVYADELGTPDYKYYDLFKTLEMADEVWADLAASAKEQGIALHLDVFGARSLALAEKIGVDTVKLHGTDIANVGFLEQTAASGVSRVMLGAGGATAQEIARAVDILSAKQVIVLLGFQAYPTPDETNQIARVSLLKERFAAKGASVLIGFADHAAPDTTLRYALAAAAVGAGAQVIEKHLTLGQIMKLEDHESALNPDEFAEFCRTIRGTYSAMGTAVDSADFGMSESELGYRKMIRRHVVAKRDLAAGATIQPSDVELKRTSVEVPLTDIEFVYGKVLAQPVSAGSAVVKESLKA